MILVLFLFKKKAAIILRLLIGVRKTIVAQIFKKLLVLQTQMWDFFTIMQINVAVWSDEVILEKYQWCEEQNIECLLDFFIEKMNFILNQDRYYKLDYNKQTIDQWWLFKQFEREFFVILYKSQKPEDDVELWKMILDNRKQSSATNAIITCFCFEFFWMKANFDIYKWKF